MFTLATGLGELALFGFRGCNVGGLADADALAVAVAVAVGGSGADEDGIKLSPALEPDVAITATRCWLSYRYRIEPYQVCGIGLLINAGRQ